MPLLAVRDLRKEYPLRSSLLQRELGSARVVDGVDLDLHSGETLALIGESGSGKTTLARCILGLTRPSSGSVTFRGRALTGLSGSELRRQRRVLQMVFQDAFLALDPRQRVGDAVGEPLTVHRLLTEPSARRRRVEELLAEVGLPAQIAVRFPHELSGGQRQRVGIARALACEPEVLIGDEPVSALDVSLRAQVVNLLLELQVRRGLAMLLIGHDLGLVASVADRIAVMYLGRIVEQGPSTALLTSPAHPYTQFLLAAGSDLEARRRKAEDPPTARGEPPSPSRRPPGCAFHPRCPRTAELCRRREPPWVQVGADHFAACHDPGERSGFGP